jgi:hypothetical protein
MRTFSVDEIVDADLIVDAVYEGPRHYHVRGSVRNLCRGYKLWESVRPLEAIWPFTRFPGRAPRATRDPISTSSCARMDALRPSKCHPRCRRQRKVSDIAH